MSQRLEITLKPELFDAEGEALRRKAAAYFGLNLDRVRTVQVLTIDAALNAAQLERIRTEVFTNPVTQESSFAPLPEPFDWVVWVGYRPGVRDNPGATALEAIEDCLGIRLAPGEAVYTSRRYCIKARGLAPSDLDRIAGQLLANDIIQQWRIFSPGQWDPQTGVGIIIPKVILDHTPTVTALPIESDAQMRRISDARGLALNPNDIPTIRAYFRNPEVLAARRAVGLEDPTDIELEYISQARSDHCNHNTFRGLYRYLDLETGQGETVDNLFETCIEAPTLALQAKKDWVVSVLWDNAGVGRLDADHYYTITGETHNSPSNMEAYGGAITGIVGVYRDPMGTGLGSRLIMGAYGYCVGPRDYGGDLHPRLHPRRLLDGVIEGVRDGGNKSGIPTPFGQVLFHPGYLGKCLVFVTALGVMPAVVAGVPSEKKTTSPGYLVVLCGGGVAKDGIHGVTASSEVFSEHTPAGHVQIGDPYTQKKMHDFLLEARDAGLIRFVTDNGGGGLSSSVGESARYSNGAVIDLEKVPLKYSGLDQWEIWVSESQERMTVAVAPADAERFLALSRQHAVESTVIGTYTDTGRLQIRYEGNTCACVDLSLLESGFPQWTFDAHWLSPALRGLTEPVLGEPEDYAGLVLAMLGRPNICAKNWIARQYDHEVQGTSAVKPLVGAGRDVPSDAAVLRPVLTSDTGLAFAQALLPHYAAIDAYHMVACTIDEAVRRLIAVGGDPDHIGGVDNFCWPSIQYDPQTNPDGRFKAGQLVRACWALRDMCLGYGIPLLSGKDSMYVDGHLPGRFGERHKVSALPTLQFSAVSVVGAIERCTTLDPKAPGDAVYVLGSTGDELGGSEYYDLFGYVGAQVPRTAPERFWPVYVALARAIAGGWVASAHGVYRGGLGVHLCLTAMAGRLGLDLDLSRAPGKRGLRPDKLLFSESAGRFIVTVDETHQERFESLFQGLPCARIGTVNADPVLSIRFGERDLMRLALDRVIEAWKRPFGDLESGR